MSIILLSVPLNSGGKERCSDPDIWQIHHNNNNHEQKDIDNVTKIFDYTAVAVPT